MKKLKIIVSLIVLSGLFMSTQVKGQALVNREQGWTLGDYFSITSLMVTTPSGNITIWINFQLDLDDPLVPEGEDVEVTYPFSAWYWGLYFLFHFLSPGCDV